ncbi:hypothetical protein E5Z02_27320, partial [Streptomyces rhizosphaericola]
SREPGAGSREPGAGSREPGAGSREPGAGQGPEAVGSGAGSRTPTTEGLCPRIPLSRVSPWHHSGSVTKSINSSTRPSSCGSRSL